MIERTYAILALAPQVWHEQWVNRQQLLSRIGRHHAVLYSTGGWFLWDRTADEWRGAAFSGRMEHTDNVWVDESPRYLMRWPKCPDRRPTRDAFTGAQMVEMAQKPGRETDNRSDLPSPLCSIRPEKAAPRTHLQCGPQEHPPVE